MNNKILLVGALLLALLMVGGVFAQDDERPTPLDDDTSGEISPLGDGAVVIEVPAGDGLSREQGVAYVLIAALAAVGAFFVGKNQQDEAKQFVKELNKNAGLKDFMEMVAIGVVPSDSLKDANKTIKEIGELYDKTTNRLIDFMRDMQDVARDGVEFALDITDGELELTEEDDNTVIIPKG